MPKEIVIKKVNGMYVGLKKGWSNYNGWAVWTSRHTYGEARNAMRSLLARSKVETVLSYTKGGEMWNLHLGKYKDVNYG